MPPDVPLAFYGGLFRGDVSSTHPDSLAGIRLNAHALTGTRGPALPEAPTFAEAGLPGFVSDSWYGILAPAGTPKPIISKLNAEIQRVLALPDVKQRLAMEGAEAMGNTPEQFEAQIRRGILHGTKVARHAKVSLE